MNKLVIVFLAVCLISVNSAIVKRDAETATPNYLQDAQKKLEELGETVKNEFTKTFDPEKIKKTLSAGVDEISKMFNQPAPKQ